jgi:hypothetical protein
VSSDELLVNIGEKLGKLDVKLDRVIELLMPKETGGMTADEVKDAAAHLRDEAARLRGLTAETTPAAAG